MTRFVSRCLPGCVIFLLLLLAINPPQNAVASAPVPSVSCDEPALVAAEENFRALMTRREQDPALVRTEAYRQAASWYLDLAEACYQASLPAQQTAPKIDDGGLMPPDEPDISPLFVTYGRKWGLDSPFTGGQDVSGPGSGGGVITYSYMPSGVNHWSDDYVGPNTPVSALTGFSSCFYSDIDTAFAAWSAVANIQFVPVTEVGSTNANEFPASGNVIGQIRIGAHPMDGVSGTLAHAYYPPYYGYETSSTISGDIHFDTAESWSCTPGSGVHDIGLVALHEIGHSLGLRHEEIQTAVMNPIYNPSLTGLQADDINGIQSIYGTSTATYSVSGYVRTSGGSGIAGVTVDFGGMRPPVTTDSSGYYFQTGFSDGYYPISFHRADYTFSPVRHLLTVRGANLTQDTTGYVLTPAALPFNDDFESGSLGNAWGIETDYQGRVRVGNDSSFANDGSYSLWLDDSAADTTWSHAAAVLALDLSGYAQVDLSFWWREFEDDDDADDGVFISDDYGATWYQVYTFTGSPTGYTQVNIDLDA
ncbi:MAG: hypothetical protein D6706_20300, partial [Chloroflexi bacterium]